MRVQFVGDKDKFHLRHNINYQIEFKSEYNTVFVDVSDANTMGYVATVVFPGMQEFLDSFVFENVVKPNRVRKHTDFERTLYFTVGEVAELFGVSVNTVSNWVKTGKLEVHHRLPPRMDRRFARKDVMEFRNSYFNGGI